jgi:hypothetical protein
MLTFKKFYLLQLRDGSVPLYVLFTILASALVKFLYWVEVEEMPYLYTPVTRSVIDGAFVAIQGFLVLGLLLMLFHPFQSYKWIQGRVSRGAEETHWRGGLDKAMRDVAKAVKAQKSKDTVVNPANILLKEIQIHLVLAGVRKISTIETKLEGVFQGMEVERQVLVDYRIENNGHARVIVLTIGGREYLRDDDQIES